MQPWFVEYAEAIAEGNPSYRTSSHCEYTALPPRTVCPECGTETLEEQALDGRTGVTAFTTISSTIPAFSDETPSTVVFAAFEEDASVPGQLREVTDVEVGGTVRLGTEKHDEGWILTYTPA